MGARISPFVGEATGGGVGIDREEAGRALALLADPAGRVELRPLPSARSVILPGGDLAGLLDAADEAHRQGNTVYFVLNPVDPPGGARSCKDCHVSVRRWIPFDIDPLRAAGRDKDSATQAEKDAAGALAVELSEHLAEAGWPLPVQVDSGNGYYLLYRFDQPNDEITKAVLKRLYAALRDRFAGATGAVIDPTVYNASRLIKLPGTMSRKGAATADRPHRLCRVMMAPGEIRPVSMEAVLAVAGVQSGASAGAGTAPAAPGHGDAYARAALAGECGRVLLARPGPTEGRNNALNRAAFSLGQLVGGGLLAAAEVESSLLAAAAAVGLGESESRATVRSGLEAGLAQPRKMPAGKPPAAALPPANSAAPKLAAATPAGEAVVAYRASAVKPRKTEWLWPRRIPLGKLTAFAGQMGIGKTFLLCDIAARVSSGGEWPDLPGQPITPADVLIISGEDDPEDTLVPRLIECGADLDRVWFLSLAVLKDFSLHKIAILDAVADLAANLRLVIVDPPTSYLGDTDDHRNTELRRVLTPLSVWCAERIASLAFNTHLNKGGGVKTEAVNRVIGSVAWMASVRAGHLISTDPDDEGIRYFVPMKLNLARKPPALSYTIDELPDDRGRLRWLGVVDVTADQAVNREKNTRRATASEWLVERFREKLEWPSDELFRDAKEAGISRSAIFEAKETLDLPKARKVTGESGSQCWYWWVPPDWPHLAAPEPGEVEVRKCGVTIKPATLEPVEPVEPQDVEK